jgi:hypothetical protein
VAEASEANVVGNGFHEYPIPDLPGITLARIGLNSVCNYYFSGAFQGTSFEIPPGYVFATQDVFPEFARYQGAPVQVIGGRIPVLGHEIEPMVFEVDADGFRSSRLWGGYTTLHKHDAIAGSQLLVLV